MGRKNQIKQKHTKIGTVPLYRMLTVQKLYLQCPLKSITFLENGHENSYTFILHLLLIRERFLSVSSASMCRKYCFTS